MGDGLVIFISVLQDRKIAGKFNQQHTPHISEACSAAVNGIDAYPVEVEVNSGWGESITVIVGLPDAAVRESRNRAAADILMPCKSAH